MTEATYASPSFASLKQYASYNSLTSSTSTVAASVWSDTASQSSDDTSVSNSDSDSCESFCPSKQSARADNATSHRRSMFQNKTEAAAVPVELRQNPRRSGPGMRARGACPPALVRQCDRKVNFVDSLVDSSTQIVETIWPLSSAACRSELGSKAVLPLRTFIQETLRRSRTSYSTLQVALYYLVLVKPHVPQHDFTMEQPEDRHADRALQCGRRMFLAALILASKYLQDRNYSARAWSKISGLNTQEINQNEMAFLLAVNWKLHIADEVFQRWTEIVLKYTPPQMPPSPGAVSQTVSQQTADWRQLILKLNPDLSNIEALIPVGPLSPKRSDLCVSSPRSILNPPQEAFMSVDAQSTPKPTAVSITSEPAGYTPGRMAPSIGMLPTPRLTPQTSGICTPAVGAASHMLTKCSAMGLALAQVNTTCNPNHLDRLPSSATSSPQSYCPVRRSSLAMSVSSASSPESMVSDTSRTSRSSSISSVSSLASATLNSKLMASSRFRAAKIVTERASMKPSVASVPEDYDERFFSSSPESCTGPVTALEAMTRDPVSDAARALQYLHSQDVHSAQSTPIVGSRKRSYSTTGDGLLQDNVRSILNGDEYRQATWHPSLVHDSRKRARCASEATIAFQPSPVHPALNHQTYGVWDGILN